MMISYFMRRKSLLIFCVFLIGLAIDQAIPARAFPVTPLPEGNLITNPWFRAFDDPNDSALDGWTDAGGVNRHWSSSQKASNPATDIVATGVCGGQLVYCGTAARLSFTPGQSGGVAEPGVDAYLYQVVAADPAKRKLKFSTHWVSHIVDLAEVTIYGGEGQEGPWTEVWVPVHAVVPELIIPESRNTEELWTHTGLLETILETGYSHYKIEIHARLPDHISTGFKITGVYFAVEETDLAAQPLIPEDSLATPPSLPATAAAESVPTTEAAPEDTRTTERETDLTPIASEDAPVVSQLNLSAVSLSATEIELTWSANTDNRRGSKLERSANGQTDWRPLALVPAGTTGYTDTEVQPGSTYFYRVRVSNDSSGISNVVTATTPALPAPSRSPVEPTVAPVATTQAVATQVAQLVEAEPADAAIGPGSSGQNVPETIPVSSLIIPAMVLIIALIVLAVVLSMVLFTRRSTL